MQAEVLLLDKNVGKLRSADAIYQGHLQTVASNAYEVERAVIDADLVIGAVLVPGAKAPMLISNELVSRMKPGSVLVDISIDQGGCFEDSHPTTHDNPTYPVHNSLFYCVANMPGAVPHTSTYALTNVTLPYAVEIANRGWREALRADPSFALGLNTHEGSVTYQQRRRGARAAVDTDKRGAQLKAVRQVTVDEAVKRYLDHLTVERGLARHTLEAYRRDLERYAAVLGSAGRTGIGDVTTQDVAGFLAGLREGDESHQPLAASSAGRAVVAVRGLHAFAAAEGLAPVRPRAAGPAARTAAPAAAGDSGRRRRAPARGGRGRRRAAAAAGPRAARVALRDRGPDLGSDRA